MEFSPETIIHNRYRITRLLGQGGMGAVYLAHDLSLEHDVAVKINRAPGADASAQFIAEARLLAMLRHPNLPRVIDYFVEGQVQCLVMDYIPGDDLKTLLAAMGAMPLEQVLAWAAQLGSALSYLHRQTPPVIHRDVKPGNLKLSPENEVILVDFGIAKSGGAEQHTQSGAAGYTPGYAPPEQYGSAGTGPFSDQYAMAATLYALLTGHAPVDAVQRVLGQATLVPVKTYLPGVPDHVARALTRALSVRPEDRFVSVDEFMRALREPAFAPTLPYSAAAPETTMPAIQSGPQYPPVQPPVLPPPPPVATRKFPLWLALLGAALVLVLGIGAVWLATGGLPAATAPTPTTPPPTAVSASATAQPTLAATATATELPTQAPTPSLTPTLTAVPATPTRTAPPAATATATALPALGGATSLAFVSDRADGKTLQIWTMRVAPNAQGEAEALDLRQITFDEGDKQHPAWSPDGKRLAYSAPGKAGNGLDLFVMDVSQAKPTPVNVTNRPGDDVDPAWSPDGKWIAITNNGRGDKVRMVDILHPDGSELRRLSVDLEEFMPAWSPDGAWLAYVTLANNNNILYVRTKSSDFAKYEFLDPNMSNRTGQAADPTFSPDGTRLAYVKLIYQDEGQLMSLEWASRGAKIVALTNGPMDRQPAWSPDSTWLAFTSRRDGNMEIYLMRSAGQAQPLRLTNSPGKDLWPAWRP